MKYPRILAALRSARWAVTPATLHAITDTLGAHLRGTIHGGRALQPDQPSPTNAPSTSANFGPSVAVIPVYGILGKHLSSFEAECGGCDVEAISDALDMALSVESIKSIVLDIDSPGGVVTGIPELAAKIRSASENDKPIYAFTSGQCCSAAYWIAAGCAAIFSTKSADIGSIGVYVAMCDDSEWWKKEGYKLELIKAGEYKAMGISGKPLEPAERALIQADVDAIYAMFTGDVRAGRSGIKDSIMQGQTFMGENAQAVGLVDEVLTDLTTLLEQLTQVSTFDIRK